MLPNEAARLGAQLKHRKAWGVVNIQRSTDEVVDALVEAVPLVGLELSVEYFAALYLSAV